MSAIPGVDYASGITEPGGDCADCDGRGHHGYPRLLNGLENRYGEGPDFEVMATGSGVVSMTSSAVGMAGLRCRWVIAETPIRSLMAFVVGPRAVLVCCTSMPMILLFRFVCRRGSVRRLPRMRHWRGITRGANSISAVH